MFGMMPNFEGFLWGWYWVHSPWRLKIHRNDAYRRHFMVAAWLVQETSMLPQLGTSDQKGNCQGQKVQILWFTIHICGIHGSK
jgi:hypothetical protein